MAGERTRESERRSEAQARRQTNGQMASAKAPSKQGAHTADRPDAARVERLDRRVDVARIDRWEERAQACAQLGDRQGAVVIHVHLLEQPVHRAIPADSMTTNASPMRAMNNATPKPHP